MIIRLLKKYLNRKGFISIYAILLITFLLPFLLFTVVDVNHFMQQNRKLKNIVDNAGASAVTIIDSNKISKGVIEIIEPDATNVALGIIKKDLFLNDDLTPQPQSILSGRPDIKIYVANGAGSVTTPFGTVNVKKPSVIVYGKFPVKGLWFSNINVNITKEGMSQAQFK